MALTKCKECGEEISKKATSCPNCGAPLPKKISFLVAIAGLIFLSWVVTQIFGGETRPTASTAAGDAQLADLQRQLRTQDQKSIESDRSGVLQSIRDLLELKDYRAASSLADRFAFSGDEEILDLQFIAQSKVNEIIKREKTIALLARLKLIPVANFSENAKLYGELVALNPKESIYQERQQFYDNKTQEAAAEAGRKQAVIDETIAAMRALNAERVALAGPVPEAYGGVYFAVELHLSKVANDPESINITRCSDTYFKEEGWVVGCDYRGKNGFGAIVKNSNWFVIRNNRVIAMKEASAYEL